MQKGLFIENITNIDSSYFDSELGIVGETYIVDMHLYGQLNDEDMIIDFSTIKKDAKAFIDKHLDHLFLVPKQNKHIKVQQHPSHYEVWPLWIRGQEAKNCTILPLMLHLL